jgi:hypothetical protein
MDFVDLESKYAEMNSAKDRLMQVPDNYMLQSVQDVDYGALYTNFETMKNTADQLKNVQEGGDLPDSLEHVDFDTLKTEYTGMKDLASKMKNYSGQ